MVGLNGHVAVSVFSYALAWLGLHSGSGPELQNCRCVYEDPCWPSETAFAELASQLSQPLIYPRPLAHPCYVSQNSSLCSTISTKWEDGRWRSDRPGATQHPNFEAFISSDGQVDACYLNASLGASCGQGSVPVIGVDARTIEDIQAAVNFAVEHNLKLVVKNTGHDFLGRSSGRGAFMIWTHNIKHRFIHKSFRPSGASPSESHDYALTVGAGVQWQEAYELADTADRMIVGGISPGGSVGAAGGWLLGGGHSALSPTYGLGVDNVLEISLVTSTGEYITANAYRYQDLFWALLGGGGGTFGVVTSVTYKTHPIVPVTLGVLSASVNTLQPNKPLKEAFTELVRISTSLTDQGWGGYSQFYQNGLGLSFSLGVIIPNVSSEAAHQSIEPYFNYVRDLADDSHKGNDTETERDLLTLEAAFTADFPSFWSMYKSLFPSTGQVGLNLEIGSWLIPRDALDNDYARVAETLIANPGLSFELVAGGAVSKTEPSSTGLNPAWRKAGAHAVFGIVWPDGASAETILGMRESLKKRMVKVRALAPESGAYFNEASMFEPDARHAFFGAHYERLRTIKKVYDSIDLFVVAEGVAADEWDQELKCRVS